jgi:hypothetical protein
LRCEPYAKPQQSWRIDVFLSELADRSEIRSPALCDLAVYMLPRDRGVDMRAKGLVGIHSSSWVLLVRMRQQDACPQGHILRLWPCILGSCRYNTQYWLWQVFYHILIYSSLLILNFFRGFPHILRPILSVISWKVNYHLLSYLKLLLTTNLVNNSTLYRLKSRNLLLVYPSTAILVPPVHMIIFLLSNVCIRVM